MKQEERPFDRAFKVMAAPGARLNSAYLANLLVNRTADAVAQELGIRPASRRADLLSRWKWEYKQKKEGHRGAIAFQGMASLLLPQNRPK